MDMDVIFVRKVEMELFGFLWKSISQKHVKVQM